MKPCKVRATCNIKNFNFYIKNYLHTGSPHFTRFHFARSSLYTRFIIVPNEFTLCNALHDFLTLHCQKTLSELYLSTKGTVFHFTRISLYTIYLEIQKSCKVRATCIYYHIHHLLGRAIRYTCNIDCSKTRGHY